MKLAKTELRRLAVARQFPDDLSGNLSDDQSGGVAGVRESVRRLGYLQLDTISVVGRTQHFTLWSRLPDYERAHLDAAAYGERSLFEYHGHAASYLPLADYRYYRSAMETFPWGSWWVKQHRELESIFPRIIEHIEREGPLASRDFKEPPRGSNGGWGSWKAAKYALAHLWLSGKLMVTRREGFERVFDLSERVLPVDIETTPPGTAELGRFVVRRALGGLGAATERDVRDYLSVFDSIFPPLEEMTAAGELTTVEVDGATYYIEPRTLDELPSIRREQKLRLLNPFDGLVINRKRLERLFGFRYALECYKKPDQREFGYYTLPLLRGEEFLGRLDAKADRKRKKLVLRGLWWEDGAPDSAELKRELRTELERLAAFNGCEDIEERLD